MSAFKWLVSKRRRVSINQQISQVGNRFHATPSMLFAQPQNLVQIKSMKIILGIFKNQLFLSSAKIRWNLVVDADVMYRAIGDLRLVWRVQGKADLSQMAGLILRATLLLFAGSQILRELPCRRWCTSLVTSCLDTTSANLVRAIRYADRTGSANDQSVSELEATERQEVAQQRNAPSSDFPELASYACDVALRDDVIEIASIDNTCMDLQTIQRFFSNRGFQIFFTLRFSLCSRLTLFRPFVQQRWAWWNGLREMMRFYKKHEIATFLTRKSRK